MSDEADAPRDKTVVAFGARPKQPPRALDALGRPKNPSTTAVGSLGGVSAYEVRRTPTPALPPSVTTSTPPKPEPRRPGFLRVLGDAAAAEPPRLLVVTEAPLAAVLEAAFKERGFMVTRADSNSTDWIQQPGVSLEAPDGKKAYDAIILQDATPACWGSPMAALHGLHYPVPAVVLSGADGLEASFRRQAHALKAPVAVCDFDAMQEQNPQDALFALTNQVRAIIAATAAKETGRSR